MQLAPIVCQGCERESLKPAKFVKRGMKYCSRSCAASVNNRAKRGRPIQRDMSGPKNPAWRGGISAKPYRYKLRFLEKSPEKVRAHLLVQRALRSGLLARMPCERCGSTVRIHGHHDDYTKPLDVVWLCQAHHIARHAELRRARLALGQPRLGGIA